MPRIRPTKSAGRSPLQGIPPRVLHRGDESTPTLRHARAEPATSLSVASIDTTAVIAREILPQLTELSRRVSAETLACVRTQVEPWEIVAVYQRDREVRVLICGPRRELVTPVRTLPEGWQRIAATLITDDGEVPLARVREC